MRLPLTILCAFIFLQHGAVAQTIELTSGKRQEVEGRIKYLRDESNSLTIDQVSKLKLLQVSDNKSPNFGFDRTTYWFRIDLMNHTDREDWLMEIDFAPIDSI